MSIATVYPTSKKPELKNGEVLVQEKGKAPVVLPAQNVPTAPVLTAEKIRAMAEQIRQQGEQRQIALDDAPAPDSHGQVILTKEQAQAIADRQSDDRHRSVPVIPQRPMIETTSELARAGADQRYDEALSTLPARQPIPAYDPAVIKPLPVRNRSKEAQKQAINAALLSLGTVLGGGNVRDIQTNVPAFLRGSQASSEAIYNDEAEAAKQARQDDLARIEMARKNAETANSERTTLQSDALRKLGYEDSAATNAVNSEAKADALERATKLKLTELGVKSAKDVRADQLKFQTLVPKQLAQLGSMSDLAAQQSGWETIRQAGIASGYTDEQLKTVLPPKPGSIVGYHEVGGKKFPIIAPRLSPDAAANARNAYVKNIEAKTANLPVQLENEKTKIQQGAERIALDKENAEFNRKAREDSLALQKQQLALGYANLAVTKQRLAQELQTKPVKSKEDAVKYADKLASDVQSIKDSIESKRPKAIKYKDMGGNMISIPADDGDVKSWEKYKNDSMVTIEQLQNRRAQVLRDKGLKLNPDKSQGSYVPMTGSGAGSSNKGFSKPPQSKAEEVVKKQVQYRFGQPKVDKDQKKLLLNELKK